MADQSFARSLRTLRRWFWLFLVLPLIAFAVAYVATRGLNKADYRATSLVVLGSIDATRQFEDIRAVQSLTPTYSEMLTSEAGLRPVAQSLGVPDGSNYLRRLSRKITVEPIAGTQIIEITATQRRRQGAIDLGNRLADRLIELATQSTNNQATETAIRAELDALRTRLSEANLELETLMSQFPEGGLPSLDVLLGNLRLWREEVDDLEAGQAAMSELSGQILRDETELVALQATTPYSARIPLLRANITGNNATLAAMRERSERNGALARIEELHKRIDDAEAAMSSQTSSTPAVLTPADAANVENLQQRIGVLQANIRIWRASAQDLEDSLARVTSGSAAVFQDASSVEALRQSPLMTAILAAVVGFLVALFLAFLFDSLNTQIDSDGDVEGRGHRSLGHVSRDGIASMFSNSEHETLDGRRLLPYRWLLRRIRESDHFDNDGVLAVSSFDESHHQGIAVALGLARAAARDGKRVTLVDADWPQTGVSKALALDGKRGLTAIDLHAFDEAVIDANLSSTNTAGVFALGAGPNPSLLPEMLTSPDVRSLVEYIAENSDLTIVHTSPVSQHLGAAAIAGMASGTVLVARPGSTAVRDLHAASIALEAADANLIGVVLAEGARVRSFPWKKLSRIHTAGERPLPGRSRVKGNV